MTNFNWSYNYKTYGGSWQQLGYSASSDITVRASELKDSDGTNFLNNLKQEVPLIIRAANACVSSPKNTAEHYSAKIALTLKLEAPQINSYRIDSLPPKCPGGNDGRVSIPFYRKLHEGEAVQVLLKNLDKPLAAKLQKTLLNQEDFVVFTGLQAGHYEVTMANGYILGKNSKKITTYTNNKYSHIAQFSISDPVPLSLSDLSKTDVHCKEGSDGSIILTPSGGTGNITAWYTSTASYPVSRGGKSTIPDIAAGDYTLELRDANGCRMTNAGWKVTVAQPATGVSVQELSKTDPRGYGLSDGAIEVAAQGGTGGFTYGWEKNGVAIAGSGNQLTGLGDGKYKITVRDANYSQANPATPGNLAGCEGNVEITLRQPDPLLVSIQKTRDVSCHGLDDGALEATASGGVGGYRYEWYKSVGGSWAKLRHTTPDATGLDAGIYQVFVFDKNDIKGVSQAFTLSQPNPIEITFNTTEPSCYGGNNGRVEAIVRGGNGGYTYTWPGNPGSGSVIYGEAQNYVVKVRDSKGCEGQNNVTIGQPTQLTATSAVELPSTAGASDGRITITPSGGTPGYNYRWDYHGSTSNPLTGIPADSTPYRVVVKDAHDCQVELKPRVIYPLGVKIAVKKVVSCKGDSDGELEAMPEGGVSRHYRYEWFRWQNGSFISLTGGGKVVTGVGAGRYQVKVIDTENNMAMAETEVTEPALLQAIAQIERPTSANVADGRITITPSGGTPGYNYRWDYHGSTSNPLTGIAADSTPYRVVVKDAHGCQVVLNPRVIYPLGVNLAVKKVISCKGDNDGLLEAMPEGGVSRYYRYQWFKDDGNGFREIAGDGKVSAPAGIGTYRVKVTDSESNYATGDYILTEPSLLSATFTVDIPSSPLASDGRITVFPVGGTPYADGSYRYLWDYKGADTNPLTLLPADSVPYHVLVKDAHQCETELNPRLLYPLVVNVRVKDSISCYARKDGRLEAVAEGGVSSIYYYRWFRKEEEGFREMVGENSISEFVGEGTYQVKVLDSEHNQVVSQAFVFRHPDTLRLDFEHLDPLCKDDRNGWINAGVEGGTKPYHYLWDDKTDYNSFHRTDLTCGKYHVTITDYHGCRVSGQDTLTEPDSLLVTHRVSFPTVYGGSDGTIRLLPTGGTLPYRYEWVYNHATDNPLTGLPAKESPYEVTVIDAHGCTVVDTPRMYNRLIVEIQVRDSISCYGRSDGRLAAVFAGGVGAPHSFEWYMKESEGGYRKIGSDDSVLYQVTDGIYQVKVWDRRDSLAVSEELVFRHPDSLELGFNHIYPLCKNDANGRTEAMVTGGTTPYRYFWEDIQREDVSLRDDLEDGIYKVVVTDRRGCLITGQDTLVEPDSLIIKHRVDFPSVYGGGDGTVLVIPEGGTIPYRYAWDYRHSDANPLTGLSAMESPLHVVVTDSHGCRATDSAYMYNPVTLELEESGVIICSGERNAELTAHTKGGAGKPYRFEWYFVEDDLLTRFEETDSLLTQVGVGTYRVIAFDSVGNSGRSADYTVVSPDSLRLEFEIGDLPCKYDKNGWIQAIPLGGEGPYRLEWFNGSTDTRVENLEEGRYEVKMTDKRGCFVEKKVKINSPDELLLSVDSRAALGWQRSDGAIWVTPVGGTVPYYYDWHGKECDRDTLSGVPAGEYTVTVSDSHQCRKTISGVVTEPPLLEVGVSCTQIVSCFDISDGVLMATAEGGVGNYRFDWYKQDGRKEEFVATGKYCEHLHAGDYRVKVTDGNGITARSEVYRLAQPDLLEAGMTVSVLLCKGDTSGRAEAVVKGGTLPYEYTWTNGARTDVADGLAEGRYLVVVKDAHGCLAEALGSIVAPPALTVSSKVSDPVCNGGQGSIALDITGGTGKYRTGWADGTGKTKRDDLPAGNYPVVVTDANGCVWEGEFTLNEPEEVVVDLGPERTLCRDQEIVLEPLNIDDVAGYSWLKDNEAYGREAVIRVSEGGTYRLDVVTEDGCRGSGGVTIGESDAVIDANFAMASKVEVGDILKVVNTCLPMPEYCEWIIPETAPVRMVGDDKDLAELIFDGTGEYMIGLRSVVGECEEVMFKKLTVIPEGSGGPETRSAERVIGDVQVWPNPNDGRFKVRVSLNKKSDGLLRIYAISGVLIREMRCQGDERYELTFNESLPTGIYILHLIFGTEREAVKVAVE